MSSINWSEVFQKCMAHGISTAGLRSDLSALGLQILAFEIEDAECAAGLWPATRPFGLSFGDRACLALAMRLNAAVLTTDRTWQGAAVGISVRVIR